MCLKNVYFKMAGYDYADLEHVLCIAAAAQMDMVTFDDAGGGSGYSPCKMMNEWCLPTCVMQSYLNEIMKRLENEGVTLPHIAVTGGFSMEDPVYKALALGVPYVSAVGICRASMAAAMSAKKVGELMKAGNLPVELQRLAPQRTNCSPICENCVTSTAKKQMTSVQVLLVYIPI